MPELLGSPYILPVIVVVLIALLVLLFLNMRSRKRGATGGKESKPAKVRAKRGKSGPAPLEAADATAYSEASPETAGEPPVEGQAEQDGGAPSSKSRRSTTHQIRTDAGTGGMPSADPIAAVVSDVLRGWGDVTTEDTNRLAVFRADKVSAVISAIELPKDLKNSEHARTRLGQLKHYGTSLQGNQRPFHAAPRAEFAAIGLGAPETPSGETGQPSMRTDEAAHAETAAEVAHQVASEPPYEEETAGEARAADASWGVDKKASLWDERPATDLWGSETADATPDTDTDAAPSERGLPEIGWETKAPSETEAPKAAGWDNAESAVAAAAAAFWAVSEAPAGKETVTEEELPVVDEMVVQEELEVQEEEVTDFEEFSSPAGLTGEATIAEPEMPALTDSFFQTLGEKVSTAEHLLALPAAEQETMLVFLEPAELNKVFRATGNPEIKKAIIDTLEHVGSPASLDIIQQCLEDPDPSVQMRALEAADRLLGSS